MTGLIILVPIEGRAVWIVDAGTDAELARVYDWLRSAPPVLVELATDALALLNDLAGHDEPEEAA